MITNTPVLTRPEIEGGWNTNVLTPLDGHFAGCDCLVGVVTARPSAAIAEKRPCRVLVVPLWTVFLGNRSFLLPHLHLESLEWVILRNCGRQGQGKTLCGNEEDGNLVV